MVTYQHHYSELTHLGVSNQSEPQLCALWIATEWVATHSVARPLISENKWRPLLGYLLEDQLLAPLETLHFAVVDSDDKTMLVQSVARHALTEALQQSAAAGFKVVVAVADFYALPWDGNTAQLLIEPGRWLARIGEHAGIAGSAEQVEPLLYEWLEQNPQSGLAVASACGDPLPTALNQRASATTGHVNWQFASLPAVNLLQGELRVKSSSRWHKALKSSLPLLVWSVLAFAALAVFVSISSAIDRRDVADLTRYRTYLANQLVAGGSQLDSGELRARARNDLTQLRTAAQLRAAPVYPLAEQLEPLLATSAVTLRELSWRGSEVTLAASGSDDRLAALRRGLVNLPSTQLVALEIDQATPAARLTATLRWEGQP